MSGDAAALLALCDRLDTDREGLPRICDHCRHADWAHRDDSYECLHKAISGPRCPCAHFMPDPVPELVAAVRRLLADRDAVQRVRAALATEEEYTRGVEPTDVPKCDYGPSEWRLHGDARGRRMVIAEIRRALGEPS